MNYAEKLGTEECFFKVLPQNIGEIQYCRSTNPKAEKDSPKVRRKQYLMAIGIPVLIAGGLAAIFNDSLVFIGIECFVALIVIIIIVLNINSFDGLDFFVGSEGYAIMSFNGDRKDAKIIEEERFEKYSDFVSMEVDHYKYGQYQSTKFEKYFYNAANSGRKVLGVEWGGSIDKSQEYYKFMQDVESAWSSYYFEKVKEQFATTHKIAFNIYTDSGCTKEYLVFEGETLKVGDRVYDKSTLKDVRIGNGVLIIEHVNHSTKLFGLIEEGNQEEIPFSIIANSKVFMLFFEDFVARTQK